MDDPERRFEDLVQQIRNLQDRVILLEQRAGHPAPQTGNSPETFSPYPEGPSLEATAGAVPVLGKALLAIACAYLLRALTEFGTLPRGAGVSLGIAYALLWLVLAARTSLERRLVITIYGLTSVLVLAPLLWESTVRFNAVPPWATAAVLAGFSVLGLVVSWRKNLAAIAWITTLGGVLTAAVLLVATHDVVPFAVALLAIAAAIEFSAVRDHWLSERSIVAVVNNLAVIFLTYMVTRENGLPEGYAPIPVPAALLIQVTLLVIYLGSTVARTLVRGLDITFFETFQAVAAFVIGMGGALRVAEGKPAAAAAAGLFAILAGAGCYIVSFAFLDRAGSRNRNFYTYSTFAILLALAGSRILLDGAPLAAVWSALALGCVWIGVRAGRNTLRLHGALYIVLAGLFSGITVLAASLLAGMGNTAEPLAGMSAIVALAVVVCNALCYAAAWRLPLDARSRWTERLSTLMMSANLVWAVAGLSAGALLRLWAIPFGAAPAPSGTIRTAVLTIAAVLGAWAGARWRRPELIWLIYPLMILAAYKLVAQDLGRDSTLTLFVSLLFYGGALMLLPRMAKPVQ